MANPYLILWADPTANKLYSGWNQNTEARTPIIKQGDEVGVELHWVQRGNFSSIMQEIAFPPTATITLAVGRLDAEPIGGTFTLTYGANTTSPLAYNVTATQLQAALNALASITAEGGVTVTKSGIQFRIVWNNVGVYTTNLTGDSDALYPTSNAAIVETKAGSATAQRVVLFKIKQAFIAALQTFAATPAPSIATSNIYGNTWRVSIDNTPKEGVFSLTVTSGATNYVTQPVSADADASEVLTALNALGISGTFTVTRSADFVWDISVPATVVNVQAQNGLIGFSSMYGVLDMNTAECEEFLAGSESAIATLEVQVDVGGEIQTLIRTNVQILNDLIDVSSFNVVELEDVMPVDSVVRYDTSQSLTPTQKLTARNNIGAVDGASITTIESDILSLDGRVIALEDLTDQPVLASSNVTFNSVQVTSAATTDPFYYSPSTNGHKFFVKTTGFLRGEWWASSALQSYWSLNASTGITLSNSSDTTQTRVSNSGIQFVGSAGITFADSSTQTTAFNDANYLSKSGNLSGLTNTVTARSNLGLGTMATENASGYLTTSVAAATYLTQADAITTYEPLIGQSLGTGDNVRFMTVYAGIDGVGQTIIAPSGIVFFSGNEVQDIAYHVGTVQTGGSGAQLHASDYPDEVEINIGGTIYRVPARTL